ncbi:hypothetical protein EST38_g10253 [Candolleomyces aberdarensis]|uniref:Arrestin-like N-terminal domain-containing protein n=1 Tax=Candolleomyces aberdarensis TaxID=2316362 RepID=A0A4Q2DB28_9AGAR|nr:hypothetical protein EST38_g10253 [Candolleomyces aberdarensis]
MYEVVVKINSGLLHTKQRINANVLYVPVLRAPPLPLLRASAYFNGASSLVGPVEDRRGWFALPPSYFRVSTTKDTTPSTADIKCTAFIANPAAYTRGTVIPCHLICELLGEDPHGQYTGSSSSSILNLLTSRKSPILLKLLQNVRYSQDPQRIAPTGRFVKAGQSSQDKEERTVHLKEVGEAVWWKPVSNDAPSSATPGKSSLEGEIHLDAGLLPSTDVPFLEVSYTVSLSFSPQEGLDIQPLTPQGRSSKLSSAIVKIGTAHDVESPIPVPFTLRPAPKKRDLSTVETIPYFGRARVTGI